MHCNSKKVVLKRDVMNEQKYSANKGKKDDDFQIILCKIIKKNE